MPIYSDSNYYYTGGSSQLYSPYYVSSPYSTSTTSPYTSYSSTYSRPIGGSYIVPLTPSRSTSSYTTPHSISSRYQPKLTTITEASPLISSTSRHGLIPLTRIQSPKFSYSKPSSSTTNVASRYIPPRPILINTADIDVSSSRYRKRKEPESSQEEIKPKESPKPLTKSSTSTASQSPTPSPSGSIKKRGSIEKPKETTAPITSQTNERRAGRSTIRRNRPVVRLSIIHPRSKDLQGDENLTPPERQFHDLPHYTEPEPEPENLGWRQRLADDLANIPAFPIKKSPGELMRERYLIQEVDKQNEAPKRDYSKLSAVSQPIEQVVVALDPMHHTIRRLSLPKCPTFHDICEDISSDKIDDDLNAGELRRRASLIQETEQELYNQLQKSASGGFQLIHLERRGSHDSQPDENLVIGGKRKSKKGKKVRHKITAFVDVDDPVQMPVLVEKDENAPTPKLKDSKLKPKFSFNVDSVDEHAEVNKVLKLPKRKSVKKSTKSKEAEDEKPKSFVSTAEIFTFSQKSIDANQKEILREQAEKRKLQKQIIERIEQPECMKTKVTSVETPILMNATLSKVQPREVLKSVEQPMALMSKDPPKSANAILAKPQPREELKNVEQSKSVKAVDPPKSENALLSKVQPREELKNIDLPTALKCTHPPKPTNALLSKAQPPGKKQESENVDGPKSHKSKLSTVDAPKPLNAILSNVQQQDKKVKTPSPSREVDSTATSKVGSSEALKLSASLELVNKKSTNLEKSQSLTMETKENTGIAQSPSASVLQSSVSLEMGNNTTSREESKEPSVATPKPIRKGIQKSESGEDFWSQIGTRETIYMANRKKSLHEFQWKRLEEDESTFDDIKPTNPEAPAEKVKSPVLSKKKTPTKPKDEKTATKKSTPKKKTSPLVKKSPKAKPIPTTAPKFASPKETNETLTPTVSKTSETSTKIKTTIATASTTTTTPKIDVGQAAKSPEHQNSISSPTTTINNNAATSIVTLPSQLPSLPTSAEEKSVDIQTKVVAKQSATASGTTTKPSKHTNETTPKAAAPTVEKHLQPEATTIKKVTERSKTEEKCTIDTKSSTDSDDKTKLPLSKPKVATKSPPSTSPLSTQQTSSTPINADHFIMVAPPPPIKTANNKSNVATSPKTNKAKKTSSPAKASGINQQKQTKAAAAISDKTQTTTPIAIVPTTAAVAATAATISKTTATIVATTPSTSTSADIAIAAKIANEQQKERGDESKETGSKLSKYATVSDLAQCLRDVDADIEDIIWDISDDGDDDGSLSDISSPDGCENLSASMKKKLKLKKKKERKAEEKARFDPQKKIKIDTGNKCYVSDEKPRFPLVATPRPLWRREKVEYPDDDTDSDSESETGSAEETTEDSEDCTTSEEYEDDLGTTSSGVSASASKDNVSIIRMSTCSNDSGFEGGTAPSSPKKMLECEVNCHKKCERLTANLCGVNQKLIVEALAHVKRGAREARESPGTPPSSNPAYNIDTNVEADDETSHTYSEFQKSGRFTAPATVIPKFKNYCVDDFHFLAVLGKGSFGKVLLAELRDTSYYYAVKCLKKDVVLEDDDVDSTLIERKVLALGTKHPYLCHLFCTFQTESHLFFVMEYLNGGDLMFHIQESGRFTEERARFYGAEIISGLKFLHKKGIIYRDLKLDNVLLDYEGHVRIADFGMCKLQIYLDKTADSFCGTPDYMAPEIIKGEKYNQNVDWWSFGVLLYEMLIGQSPFSGCDEDELFWSICNEIPWFPVYISAEALSILKGLLEKDYSKRIGTHYSPAGDVVEHKFFAPIDWGLLEKRELKPPFRPQVKHPLDTQYFDRVFTKERVRLTPIDKDILQSMDQKQFLGFTYTNPHIALD